MPTDLVAHLSVTKHPRGYKNLIRASSGAQVPENPPLQAWGLVVRREHADVAPEDLGSCNDPFFSCSMPRGSYRVQAQR